MSHYHASKNHVLKIRWAEREWQECNDPWNVVQLFIVWALSALHDSKAKLLRRLLFANHSNTHSNHIYSYGTSARWFQSIDCDYKIAAQKQGSLRNALATSCNWWCIATISILSKSTAVRLMDSAKLKLHCFAAKCARLCFDCQI